jgi:hypothetical protein
MRLSWYADSRVAVFSIWQGSRCTGTFRLPFADLARMVQTLQSGPMPRGADTGGPRRQVHPGGPGPAGFPETGSYGYPDRDAARYRDVPDHGAPGYGPGRPPADAAPAYGGYGGDPGYGLPDYDPPNYSDAPRYPEPGHHRTPEYPDWNGYGPGDDYPNGSGYAGSHSPRPDSGYDAGEQFGHRPARAYPAHHSGEWEAAPRPSGSGTWSPRAQDADGEPRAHGFPSVPARNEPVSDDWGAATASYPAP